MAFNPLHLNNLQQARCCCWCKVKNSESKSQHYPIFADVQPVVVAGVKLKILKANHNILIRLPIRHLVVVAGVKLKILKANHNQDKSGIWHIVVVVAGVKLKILKANHNSFQPFLKYLYVVVAGVKLKILKANHNDLLRYDKSGWLLLLV